MLERPLDGTEVVEIELPEVVLLVVRHLADEADITLEEALTDIITRRVLGNFQLGPTLFDNPVNPRRPRRPRRPRGAVPKGKKAKRRVNASRRAAPKAKPRRKSTGRTRTKSPPGEKSIELLELNNRAKGALRNAGIDTIGKLCDTTLTDLGELQGLGNPSIVEIVGKLKRRGLSLAAKAE